MKYETEITIEVDTDLESLVKLLESNGFSLKEEYDLNDIYMINENDKSNDYLSMLNKCVLIRHIIEKDNEIKMLTYKYKEYNNKKEITKQGKIKVNIDDIEKTKLLFENLNFEELIRINDHMLVYASETDEVVIRNVNGKHIYIEIEDNGSYNSVDEMKEVIIKNNIPMKGDNFFVKKAEIELMETYDK